MARDEIIYGYLKFTTILVEAQHVEAHFEVVEPKQLHDLLWVTGEQRDCGQSITDAQLALFHIVGINTFEQVVIRRDKLSWSQPHNLLCDAIYSRFVLALSE